MWRVGNVIGTGHFKRCEYAYSLGVNRVFTSAWRAWMKPTKYTSITQVKKTIKKRSRL